MTSHDSIIMKITQILSPITKTTFFLEKFLPEIYYAWYNDKFLQDCLYSFFDTSSKIYRTSWIFFTTGTS